MGEKIFTEWPTKEVVAWLRLIENGRFNKATFIKGVEKLDINGKTLRDLCNDSLPKLIGRGALSSTDRQLLIANIDRVTNAGNGQQMDKCTICVVGKVDSVFLPCGHQSICFKCYEKDKNRFRNCPICRVRITKVIKTYMNGF